MAGKISDDPVAGKCLHDVLKSAVAHTSRCALQGRKEAGQDDEHHVGATWPSCVLQPQLL